MAKVMVVDDEAHIRRLLTKRLVALGYEVTSFENPVPALLALENELPDLILMDINMPVMDGLEACRQITAKHPDVPVVFLSARGDVQDRIVGLEAGGRDYILKPFIAEELIARVRAALREKAARDKVEQRAEEFEIQAITDALTGMHNRRYIETRIPTEISRAARYHYDIAAMMTDIDNFKAVNDTHGHPVGDKVLQFVSDMIRQSVRTVDLVCRYGGEEFLILLPETDLAEAGRIAERLRKLVAETEAPAPVGRVTLSIGIAAGADETLIERADKALYAAKRGGKNRVESAT